MRKTVSFQATLLVVFAILLIVVVVLSLITRNNLLEKQDEIADIQSQLTAQLEETESRLSDTEDRLTNSQIELTNAKKELADTKNQLAKTDSNLLKLQARLYTLFPENEILRPIDAGNETSIDSEYPDSGYHWNKVNEVDANDNSSYISNKNGAAGIWQRDLFILSNHSGGGIITSIKVYIRTRHNISDARASIRTHDTTYDSPGITNASEWKTYSYTWNTNPYTGTAWTWSEVDDLEAGVSLQGSNGGPDWSDCTQVYVEVDYSTLEE